VRPYRGVSADTRRAERRERLVDAALDEIGERGIGVLTMKGVCARAGLTERYFYESFRDRDGLLKALHDAAHEEVDRHLAAALAEAGDASLFDRARATAGAVVSALTDDPRIARTYSEAAGHPALSARQAAATQQYAGLVAALMRESGGLDAPEHQPRLELVSLVLVSGLIHTIGQWLDGSIALSRDELLDELARLAVAAADTVRDS
jgi:AcrR family transcriptional regulator